MIVMKSKPRSLTEEQRRRALSYVKAGATVREAAALTGASFVDVTTWISEAGAQHLRAARQRKGPCKPVYIAGVRLGKMALWT